MKCILLCAGYATRLFPLTENFPKALLDIGGRPLLDYILDEVNSIDEVDEIYVITNAKYTPHFEEWAQAKNNIKPISVINDNTHSNDDRLGAIGDIKYTINEKNIDDDMLIIAGDNLFEFKLRNAVDLYNKVQAPVVCVKEIDDVNVLRGIGVAEVDDAGRICGFEEKPQEPKSNLGVFAEYIYPRNVISLFDRYIAEGNNKDAPGNFVKWLYRVTPTYAYVFNETIYDVGTHEALAEVSKLYRKK